MEFLIISNIALSVVFFAIIIYFLYSNKGKKDNTDEDIKKFIDGKFHQNMEIFVNSLSKQFESSQKIVREMTEIKTAQTEVLNFSRQLHDLEKTLKNPQRRGIIGEYLLEAILSNVFTPNNYKLQYQFKNGVRADSVILLKDNKKIAIDAKFQLDNYSKILETGSSDYIKKLKEDLQSSIKQTSKYIIEEEGTLGFAFMFIPSEALYYDLLSQKIGEKDLDINMIEYAFEKHKVIIISPTTLLAYLQTVNLGLKSMKLEENIEDVKKNISKLQKHLDEYAIHFEKIGDNINTLSNTYKKAQVKFRGIDKDLVKLDKNGDGLNYNEVLLDE